MSLCHDALAFRLISQSEPSGLRPLLDGLCRCVSMVVIVAQLDGPPFRGVSSSRWMRLWWPGSDCCLVSWARSCEGIAGYGMEYPFCLPCLSRCVGLVVTRVGGSGCVSCRPDACVRSVARAVPRLTVDRREA